MKIAETYTYYVIYNITKEEYYSDIVDVGHYRIEYKFNKLISEAILYNTRKEANEDIREWINRNSTDKYIVKKIRLDYSINN